MSHFAMLRALLPQPVAHLLKNKYVVSVGGTALACLMVVAAERDPSTLPFVIALCTTTTALALALSRRPRFALTMTGLAMILSTLGSMAKYKFLAMNAHVIDLWFYLRGGETSLYLIDEFPLLVGAAFVTLVAVIAFLTRIYRREQPQYGLGRASMTGVVLGLVALPLTLPREVDDIAYHIRKGHFVSSFFVSFTDLPKLMRGDPVFGKLGVSNTKAPAVHEASCDGANLPDIVLVLSESAVPPFIVPGWRYHPGVLTRFMSFDDRIHRAGVETHGGGTWISEASVMTGLSMADFGWMRSYPTMLLPGRVHNGLPATLAACGYETKYLSPANYFFIGNGPFMSSLGFTDYVDRRRLAAQSQHEPDHWYFDRALELVKEHRRTSKKPLFLYIETTTAHAPYDYRFEPERVAQGEPFGNDEYVDEYLRRLSFAQDDFASFMQKIEDLGRPTLMAEFGDHHPYLTSDAFERVGQLPAGTDFTSPMYQTFYAVHPLNFEPNAKLPDVPVLDLAYLGITLMEIAGVPLDASALERRTLRDVCDGRFHTCTRRRLVDSYIGRLVASGLLAAL